MCMTISRMSAVWAGQEALTEHSMRRIASRIFLSIAMDAGSVSQVMNPIFLKNANGPMPKPVFRRPTAEEVCLPSFDVCSSNDDFSPSCSSNALRTLPERSGTGKRPYRNQPRSSPSTGPHPSPGGTHDGAPSSPRRRLCSNGGTKYQPDESVSIVRHADFCRELPPPAAQWIEAIHNSVQGDKLVKIAAKSPFAALPAHTSDARQDHLTQLRNLLQKKSAF